jgi:hypothetical protein
MLIVNKENNKEDNIVQKVSTNNMISFDFEFADIAAEASNSI